MRRAAWMALRSASGVAADSALTGDATLLDTRPRSTDAPASPAAPRRILRLVRSWNPDMIALQRLAHAMHGAAAVRDHRHVGIVYGQPLGAACRDEILAGFGHQ